MTPGGRFIERTMQYAPPAEPLSAIVERYLHPKATLEDISAFEILVKGHIYNPTLHRVENEKKLHLVHRVMGKRFSNPAVKEWLRLTPATRKYWYCVTSQAFARLMRPHLRAISVSYAKDYPAWELFPVYTFAKK